MAKEKMVFFRTAIGGFNKSDVNSYIEKLNFEFSERERISKKKYEALENKCSELEEFKTKYEDSKATVASLEEELAKRDKDIDELYGVIEEKKRELDALILEKQETENEINVLSERISSLSEVISKSEKYDDISAQVGEIIISAKYTAETIISKAEKEAAAKKAAADKEIESAASSFNARAANAAHSVKNHLKKLANDSYSVIAQKAAETSELLHKLAAHISDSTAYFDEKISQKDEDIESAITYEASKIFSDDHRLTFKNEKN